MNKWLSGFALASLTLVGSANAADLPTKPVYKAPPPVAAPVPYNWTGIYLGGHFGGGWARKAWDDRGAHGEELSFCCDDGDSLFPLDFVGHQLGEVGSHNAIGPLGGFQVGINWQTGHWVLGIEGTYSFADLKGDHQNSVSGAGFFEDLLGDEEYLVSGTLHDRFFTKVTGIATIAGRIGITSDWMDRTLFYVKGGAAFARDQHRVNSQFGANGCPTSTDEPEVGCFVINGNGSWSGNQNRWGWMAGLGLEFGLFDNWTAFVEYDFLGFGSRTVRLNGSATAFCEGECPQDVEDAPASAKFHRDFSINQNIQVVKLGLNYRFNWGKGKAPIVAGY